MSENQITPSPKPERNDPWIILLPAAVFVVVGCVLSVAKHSERITVGAGSRFGSVQENVMDVEGLHVLGWFGISIGVAIVAYYFKLRRELRR